jgi:hypothetical protein
VNSRHGVLYRIKGLWLSAWPLWTLMVFASLAVITLLSAGYVRTAIAAPILLMAPGSLTLGAIFSKRQRPQGVTFVCYSAVLSAVWSAFASLALYVLHVLITAATTYWCLLTVSLVLAIAGETRLVLARQGPGTRVARRPEAVDSDLSQDETDEAEEPASVGSSVIYTLVAIVAGISLLAGGLYAYDHLPRPAPVGYTYMAWTDPAQFADDISIGPAGSELHFQIVHHQSDTTTFQLSAELLGTPSQPLASPATMNLGPNQTFQGVLFVPSPPNGCTFRLVVTITAPGQIDSLTKKPQTWSINADIRDSTKSARKCGP